MFEQSNFGQDTVMVKPFSEVGMATQVSAIQAVTKDVDWSSHDSESLPVHLRDLLDLLDQTSLDENQQHQLPVVLLRYTDLFPAPGSTLTRMRWNTRYIWGMDHRYVVHPAGFHLRK